MSEPLGFTLSGEPIVRPTGMSRQLLKMHGRLGRAKNGEQCGGCVHLVTEESPSRRRFFKCQRYGRSRSQATDWRKKWPACGGFAPVVTPEQQADEKEQWPW